MLALFNLGVMEIIVLAVLGLGCPLTITGIVLLVVFLTKQDKNKNNPDQHVQE